MNAEVIPPKEGTEIAIPEQKTLETLLKEDGGLQPLLDRIKEITRASVEGLDPASAKDRAKMKSEAHKVSSAKVVLEKRSKDLTEKQRKEIAAVNAGRDQAVKQLEELRDELKKPAVDFESAEKAREAELREKMDKISTGSMNAASPSSEIQQQIEFVKSCEAIDFEGMSDLAGARMRGAIEELEAMLILAQQREENEAELAKLRAEAEARRIEDEKRAAEDQAKADAAREVEQQNQREKDAAMFAAKAEREKAEAAETARKEAEEKAARDAEEAKERAEREKAEAIEAERKRIEAEAEEKRKADAKRASDRAHVTAIRRSAKEALMQIEGVDEPLAILIVLAINGRCIPAVTIQY